VVDADWKDQKKDNNQYGSESLVVVHGRYGFAALAFTRIRSGVAVRLSPHGVDRNEAPAPNRLNTIAVCSLLSATNRG
jgi:hypothetical protein